MPTPQIGRVRYVLPRAVNVRQGDAMTDTHSAVHGTVAVYTDTLTETQAIRLAHRLMHENQYACFRVAQKKTYLSSNQ